MLYVPVHENTSLLRFDTLLMSLSVSQSPLLHQLITEANTIQVGSE